MNELEDICYTWR